MTFSLLKAQALLKAAQHKYTHRKLIGRDPKTNRKRYRYYYAEHHGGGITSAEIEAGSAFKLTFKGRRGHFHVQSVEGDTVTVKHDGRPNSKPVEMTKAEFRALLKRQHETVENKKREKAQENRRRGRKKRKGSKRTKRKTAPQTQAPEQTPQVQDRPSALRDQAIKRDALEAVTQDSLNNLETQPFADLSDVGQKALDLEAGANALETEMKEASEAEKKQIRKQIKRARKLADQMFHYDRAHEMVRNTLIQRAKGEQVEIPRGNKKLQSAIDQVVSDLKERGSSWMFSEQETPQVQDPEQGADNFETMPEPDPSPAREQLTETAREVEEDRIDAERHRAKPENQEVGSQQAREIDRGKQRIETLKSIHGSDIYDHQLDSLKHMASEGVSPKVLLTDLRNPPKTNRSGSKIQTLSDGTLIAISADGETAGISFPESGEGEVDAFYNIPKKLKNKESSIFTALAFMAYGGRDEEGDRIIYESLEEGDQKRLRVLDKISKALAGVQELENFETIERGFRERPEVVEAPTQTSITEHKNLPTVVRKMLQGAKGGKSYRSGQVALPWVAGNMVSATDGKILVTAPLKTNLPDRTAFLPNGETDEFIQHGSPPTEKLLSHVQKKASPALTFTAGDAKKISAVIKATRPNKGNTEHVVSIDSTPDSMARISYMGKVLGTFPQADGASFKSVNVNAEYLNVALQAGSCTLHASLDPNNAVMFTSASASVVIMPIKQ